MFDIFGSHQLTYLPYIEHVTRAGAQPSRSPYVFLITRPPTVTLLAAHRIIYPPVGVSEN